MKRYYVDYRDEAFAVVDRKTDKIVILCPELSTAKAHCRGLNR